MDERRRGQRRDPAWNPWQRPARETLIDRQIREAMDEGAFDDLPFQGERIPIDDDSAAGDWALAFHILRNAEIAPPWIEADKHVRELLAKRDALVARSAGARPYALDRTRRELASLVEETNRAIAYLNDAAPTDRQHRRPLDLATELARLTVDGEGGEPPQRPGTTSNT